MKIKVYQLGQIEYETAFLVQEKLHARRISGDIADVLLILEHPPTFTVSKKADMVNIRVDEKTLKKRNVPIFSTDRGGSITFHGPGQIVGYPIMELSQRGKDIHQYIRNLEQVIMETLTAYSVDSRRDDEHIGVWVGSEKIAAIGVRVKKWVTKHGFAVNVNTDLSYFDMIQPCGIMDKGVTSLHKILNRNVNIKEAVGFLIDKFSTVFNVSIDLMGEQENDVLLNF
jgi:lipoyl(octanoyl) transferase